MHGPCDHVYPLGVRLHVRGRRAAAARQPTMLRWEVEGLSLSMGGGDWWRSPQRYTTSTHLQPNGVACSGKERTATATATAADAVTTTKTATDRDRLGDRVRERSMNNDNAALMIEMDWRVGYGANERGATQRKKQ